MYLCISLHECLFKKIVKLLKYILCLTLQTAWEIHSSDQLMASRVNKGELTVLVWKNNAVCFLILGQKGCSESETYPANTGHTASTGYQSVTVLVVVIEVDVVVVLAVALLVEV